MATEIAGVPEYLEYLALQSPDPDMKVRINRAVAAGHAELVVIDALVNQVLWLGFGRVSLPTSSCWPSLSAPLSDCSSRAVRDDRFRPARRARQERRGLAA